MMVDANIKRDSLFSFNFIYNKNHFNINRPFLVTVAKKNYTGTAHSEICGLSTFIRFEDCFNQLGLLFKISENV